MLRLNLTAAILFLATASMPLRAAGYTDPAAFLTALASMPPATISTSPVYTAVYTDAYGSYTAPFHKGAFSAPAPVAGTITGYFGCFDNYNPCEGAFAETLTFPYQISGFAGQINFFDLARGSETTPLIDLPLSLFTPMNPANPNGSPYSYVGFYAETFAPTNTLTFIWTPGLASADAMADFVLTSATVLVPTPAPASLAVLIAPLFAAAMARHSRSAA